MARIISIISGKGGVGKTTLTANLGTYLAAKGKDVLLVDANLSGANLGLHLDIPESYPFTLNMLLRGRIPAKEAVYRHFLGFDVVPASIVDTTINPRRLKHVLKEFAEDRDFIIIDSAPGINHEALASIECSDEIILITTPEIPSVVDVARSKKLAEKHGKKILGVVMNRVGRDDFELEKQHVEEILSIPVISVIPEHKRVREAVSVKTPVVAFSPDSRASVEMKRLAHFVLKEEFQEPGFWWRLMTALKIK